MTKELFNKTEITISDEEYLSFKVGDKYYYSGSKSGYKTISTQREADLANRLIEPKWYLESAGGRYLVT